MTTAASGSSAATAACGGTVVAVDVGTSAVRAALVTARGEVAVSSRVERASVGGEYFDAETLLEEVRSAIAALADTDRAPGPRPAPAAIGISAHIGTVAVDANIRPVEASGGWSDQRGIPELHAIDERLQTSLLHAARRPALTGGALAYALALASSPDLARRVRHLLSPKDFLIARLSGEVVTDTVDAAYTLISDVTARAWHTAVAEALGLDTAWLPRQAAPSEIVGRLSRAAAESCRLPAGTPVVAGGPDGSVGIGLLLGSNAAAIADVAGTTDVVGRLIDHPDQAPAQAMVNPALVAERWIAGGASGMTGGAVAQWRSLVGAVDDSELTRIPPGADGLLVLPTMTGSRFPRWRPADRGGVIGQRPEHSAAHLLRAAQEGAAYTVREGIDLLDSPALGAARLPIVLAGGTARSRTTAQLRADVLHRTTLVCAEPEVTLLGAAALALVGSGLAHDLDDARARIACEFQQLDPAHERALHYDALYAAWRAAREAADRADTAGTHIP
ncbi:FGGY-family carbohydrate kinase [Saccharopolyspora sp. K220]|uniref:xylulokinase n=1 Tax=Saccharopolyspora soli TaxID=2926618 RepID=UPI001F58639F|nr:FGGY-family carbohydrate kinase [Saccharopolyspora soli]MCI2418428.1 FGGY-family carbohydrate kinase [Saccharopolyspora soli]